MKRIRRISSLQLFSIAVFFILFIISFASCKQNRNIKKEEVKTSKTLLDTKNVHPGYDSIQVAHLGTLFEKAMIDAQNPTPKEQYDNLSPIKGNLNLIDTLINGERYIQVVSWKSHPEDYSKKGIDSTKGNDIWVTLAPIIKDSCKSFFKTQKDPIMRLRQLLGLQPFTQEKFFLELWVKPEDLYRPCPDSETDDTICELNLPIDVTKEYRTWFNNTRAVQYTDCTDTEFKEYGYPWTQLGYTYDWSLDNPSNIGLSEFIIRRHRYMYIRGKHKTKVYCTE